MAVPKWYISRVCVRVFQPIDRKFIQTSNGVYHFVFILYLAKSILLGRARKNLFWSFLLLK